MKFWQKTFFLFCLSYLGLSQSLFGSTSDLISPFRCPWKTNPEGSVQESPEDFNLYLQSYEDALESRYVQENYSEKFKDKLKDGDFLNIWPKLRPGSPNPVQLLRAQGIENCVPDKLAPLALGKRAVTYKEWLVRHLLEHGGLYPDDVQFWFHKRSVCHLDPSICKVFQDFQKVSAPLFNFVHVQNMHEKNMPLAEWGRNAAFSAGTFFLFTAYAGAFLGGISALKNYNIARQGMAAFLGMFSSSNISEAQDILKEIQNSPGLVGKIIIDNEVRILLLSGTSAAGWSFGKYIPGTVAYARIVKWLPKDLVEAGQKYFGSRWQRLLQSTPSTP